MLESYWKEDGHIGVYPRSDWGSERRGYTPMWPAGSSADYKDSAAVKPPLIREEPFFACPAFLLSSSCSGEEQICAVGQ